MPKGSTWFNASEIDGKSEYCRGCISRRKSRYGKTALTPVFVAEFDEPSAACGTVELVRRLADAYLFSKRRLASA